MNNILELFPTVIGKYKMAYEQDELDFVMSLNKLKNIGNNYADDFYVLKQEKLARLKQFFKKSIEDYFSTVYEPIQKVKLKITQSWINYTEDNEYHHDHAHGNSFISGVYYFKTTGETDGINLYNQFKPIIDFGYFDFSKTNNHYNASEVNLPIEPGLLYLFPSRLVHGVSKNKTNNLRVSLSFNTFFKGKIGEVKALTYLNIK
jgi:uncharacterized protein (TIGR02466 family)